VTNAAEAIKIDQYLEIVLRRRWLIIIPFCLSMMAGIYLALTLPKYYSAETLILVQPQRVPSSYVRSIVSTDLDSRLSTLSQQIMSRTNLENIINEFELFHGPDFENMFMEDKVSSMRKRIKVKLTRARRGADAFSISFKGKDPEKVMKVANALATYFIDENLKVREAQAIGTSDFLQDELAVMRGKLEDVEKALREYRKKYMGELPEQLDSNLRILDRLQENLSEKQQSLREARASLAELLKMRQQTQVIQTPDGMVHVETPVSSLDQLKKRLADLENRYTDLHPDVIRLKNRIAGLEAKAETEAERAAGDSDIERSETETGFIAANNRQVLETKREISFLGSEISKLIRQIKIYEKRVEDTPKREQQLLALKRDYQNIQSTYNSLLARKLEAEIAVNMERKQKGEQFRILDSARLPVKPVEPDMKKLFMLVVAAGLGIGGGMIFMLEYFDTSFRKPDDIESYLGVSVLATVSSIYHSKDKIWRTINQSLSVFSLMAAFILFAGFAVLCLKGVDQTIEFIRKFVDL